MADQDVSITAAMATPWSGGPTSVGQWDQVLESLRGEWRRYNSERASECRGAAWAKVNPGFQRNH